MPCQAQEHSEGFTASRPQRTTAAVIAAAIVGAAGRGAASRIILLRDATSCQVRGCERKCPYPRGGEWSFTASACSIGCPCA